MLKLSAVLLLTLGLTIGSVVDGQSRPWWNEKFYNPKPDNGDLVLPMPCGGAMVFRKVEVPTDHWTKDKSITLGQEDDELAYAEGVRETFLSGSFTDPKAPERRYFWIGKYEISQLQWEAIQGRCPTPWMRGRLPVTRINWFDAVQFIQKYTQWLYENALESVPNEDSVPGFLDLPTEAEWEYAARGGSAVSEAEFQARIFPTPEGLNKYVWYQGTESAGGKLKLTGLLQPNPLGLYDMLGNAEEIVLEPFRLSTRDGRLHGQAGGFITKGGHYLTSRSAIRSAYRREYAYFDAKQRALTKVETIGFRLVLRSTVIPTHERLAAIQEYWQTPSQRPPLAAVEKPVMQRDQILILTAALVVVMFFSAVLGLIVSRRVTAPARTVDVTVAEKPAPAVSSPIEVQRSSGGRQRSGDEWHDPVTGMAFVWVPGGCFQMGSDVGRSNEQPVHEVSVDGFWMGKHEVTQGQWRKIMGNNPSYFKTSDNHPVEQVAWLDAQEFIRKLNARGQGGFRLPTEAEWEYACRSGGRKEKYCGGNYVRRVAWCTNNSERKTHRVGQKAANGLGLYDMSGNVWEWVSDRLDENYYRYSPRNNPKGPGTGSTRVIRGGSWFSDAEYCRSAFRPGLVPGFRYRGLGFRLARDGAWPSDTFTLRRKKWLKRLIWPKAWSNKISRMSPARVSGTVLRMAHQFQKWCICQVVALRWEIFRAKV